MFLIQEHDLATSIIFCLEQDKALLEKYVDDKAVIDGLS